MPKSRAALPEPVITSLYDQLPYPVVIGKHLWLHIAKFVAERGYPRVMVVCDENVLEHAELLCRALPGGVKPLAFSMGERRKRLRLVEEILDALADAGADRKTLLIGVGGGVAGDVFGFVAGIYMRGVAFVNVATSIVAMVDASVGGKTGVDLRAGKNLAGVFADPLAVYAAVDTLTTLPTKQMREGLGEVVKHAIISGEESFARLETLADTPLDAWPWAEIVAESVAIKGSIVSEDRLEGGRRELLNLGHTFAHGFEYASDYRISHGAAVALGLRAAGLLAQRLQEFSAAEHARTLQLLQRLKLPLSTDRVHADDVLAGMASDKKARAGKLRFVLPRAIGDVHHGIEAARPDVRAVIKSILIPPTQVEFAISI